jgi:hypothetical protein
MNSAYPFLPYRNGLTIEIIEFEGEENKIDTCVQIWNVLSLALTEKSYY